MMADRDLKGGISNVQAGRLVMDHARLAAAGDLQAPTAPAMRRRIGYPDALAALKAGKRVARIGMRDDIGGGEHLALHVPISHPTRLPYIEHTLRTGRMLPYTATMADQLAEDWFILE